MGRVLAADNDSRSDVKNASDARAMQRTSILIVENYGIISTGN